MPTSEFTLMHCGLCSCGASALGVHIAGEGGGFRLTSSSNSVWRNVESLPPGDPRYRECITLLKGYLDCDHHKATAQHYLDHTPEVDDLAALEERWVREWGDRPLVGLMAREWDGWTRLNQAGVKTCGQLARHTQASLKKLPGVGEATSMAAARAFNYHRLSWKMLRESLHG
jgi:hypothetical protein